MFHFRTQFNLDQFPPLELEPFDYSQFTDVDTEAYVSLADTYQYFLRTGLVPHNSYFHTLKVDEDSSDEDVDACHDDHEGPREDPDYDLTSKDTADSIIKRVKELHEKAEALKRNKSPKTDSDSDRDDSQSADKSKSDS